jgi:hypothetical protein
MDSVTENMKTLSEATNLMRKHISYHNETEMLPVTAKYLFPYDCNSGNTHEMSCCICD